MWQNKFVIFHSIHGLTLWNNKRGVRSNEDILTKIIPWLFFIRYSELLYPQFFTKNIIVLCSGFFMKHVHHGATFVCFDCKAHDVPIDPSDCLWVRVLRKTLDRHADRISLMLSATKHIFIGRKICIVIITMFGKFWIFLNFFKLLIVIWKLAQQIFFN